MNYLTEKLVPDATSIIRFDHSHVMVLFHQYRSTARPAVKQGLVNSICLALEVHAQLEEEIFYPALRELSESDTMRKSVPEHDEMRRLMASLRSMEPTDVRYDDVLMELMRDVMHHVADEETILLPEAERLLRGHLGELGVRMTKRRLQLVVPRAGELVVNMARGLPGLSIGVLMGVLVTGLWVGTRMARR